jgi:histidinol phosphatase-like PHP family hydrolase
LPWRLTLLRSGKDSKECAPGRDILGQYLNCGGTEITVGSDAHRVDDIAAGFSDVEAMLAGLDRIRAGVFVGRKFIG